jgi:hypothetical protein
MRGSFNFAFKLALLLPLTWQAAAEATVIWNQSVNGALSENPAAPNGFTLATGTNSIIAVVGGGGTGESGIDQNWVNINIPTGLQLSQIVLAAYSSTDLQGFFGVAPGTTFPGGEGAVNTPATYLGYTHFGTSVTNGSQPAVDLVGVNVLPIMGNNVLDSQGSQGFAPPLASGSYTFLIQQLGATTNYQFDFDVTAVPEPGSISLLGLGAMALLGRRMRKVA